ncbi:glycoside hydrolase family 28 protein [Hymenobacter sp. RP-2-7]|uniref:Glycoside hydrolase family 28 protein n=1 Tax=Hymenobacter polaris TaxID=2682546 RepID=A0A7Y0AAG0_9BACT|nr:glycoside hydrolase family 28 protein [Hymenobacter polaris]NML63713.1 glycoside hydrolase family 28 protein [Hymenobacter polaris]
MKLLALATLAGALLAGGPALAQPMFPAPPTLPPVPVPQFRPDTFDLRRYGAVADGQTLNTHAFEQAIAACAQAGGGTVRVPAGLWLTGPIVLRSHVNLHLAAGALVQFTADHAQYPLIRTTWEGEEAVRCQAPLSGTDLREVAITGPGTLDGAGDTWRPVKKSKLSAGEWQALLAKGGVLNEKKDTWYPSEGSRRGNELAAAKQLPKSLNPADFTELRDYLRPNMLSLTRCQGVLLDGFTIQNSPAWTMHPLLCQQVTVRGVTAQNPWYGQNTDAIDLESCRDAVVRGCTFSVGDDGLCLKSGRDEEGRRRGVPTENALIEDCKIYRAHGGFVIGSEMSGGVRNVVVRNCAFMGTDVGLRFKTTRGRGGLVENVWVEGIRMTDIAAQAIVFDMYYMAKDPVAQPGDNAAPPAIAAQPLGEGTPAFRHFYLRDVVCRGAEQGILVRGLPERNIEDVVVRDAVLQCRQGLLCQEARNIHFQNLTLLPTDTRPVLEVQNAQGITFQNLRYPAGTDLLLRVSGPASRDVRLLGTDTKAAKQTVQLGDGAGKKAVQVAAK